MTIDIRVAAHHIAHTSTPFVVVCVWERDDGENNGTMKARTLLLLQLIARAREKEWDATDGFLIYFHLVVVIVVSFFWFAQKKKKKKIAFCLAHLFGTKVQDNGKCGGSSSSVLSLSLFLCVCVCIHTMGGVTCLDSLRTWKENEDTPHQPTHTPP